MTLFHEIPPTNMGLCFQFQNQPDVEHWDSSSNDISTYMDKKIIPTPS